MMCDYCGDDETGRTYTLEMEWPREYPEEYPDEPAQFDDPGRGTLALCGECGDSIASKHPRRGVVVRELESVYEGIGTGESGEDTHA